MKQQVKQQTSSRGPGASANRTRAMTTSRRIAVLPLVLLGLAAICAVLVLTPWVAYAQTPSVLASNTGNTVLDSDDFATTGGAGSQAVQVRSLPAANHERAQRFFTGARDHNLTSVGIRFETIADTSTAGADLEVTIRPRTTSGPKIGWPGDAICTLNDPATFTASGVQTFTVPTTCPNLAANAHYDVVLKRTSGTSSIFLHGTRTVDPPPAGFAIHNNGISRHNRFAKWTDVPGQFMIEISGNPVGGM